MADDELRIERRPELERPVMVCSFRGWNDGGQGASLANSFLARAWRAEQFADIDPELFFDFQMTRPNVTLAGGVRRIDWPENSFQHARVGPDEGGRDAVLLLGTEPSHRWKSFSDLVTGLAGDLGVSMVVTLGSLLADVPHTRPAPVTASATDPDLLEQLGLQPSRYEGPTGIVGVLLDRCREAGDPVGFALGGGPPLRPAHAVSARREGAVRPSRLPARAADRHGRARRGERGVCPAGERGGRRRRGDGRVRRRARVAQPRSSTTTFPRASRSRRS